MVWQQYCILHGGKYYRYSMGIYKYSILAMRFSLLANMCYNYDLTQIIQYS